MGRPGALRRAAGRTAHAGIIGGVHRSSPPSLLLDAHHHVQAAPATCSTRQQPVPLQRAAHAREPAGALPGHALRPLGREHRLRRRGRRAHHAPPRASRRLRPRPAHRALGREARHRHLPHLPGAADASSSSRCRAWWRMLGLQDSLWALVLVYPSFTVPFCTWLLMGFFKVIPQDIEEAAMIDGHSRLGAFVAGHPPHVGGRPPHHRHLQLHPGDAGVRLRR